MYLDYKFVFVSAWAINQRGENSVRNLRYGPQTRLVRGIYFRTNSGERKQLIICSRLFYIETSGYREASGVGMNLFRASKKLRNIGRSTMIFDVSHVTERQPI